MCKDSGVSLTATFLGLALASVQPSNFYPLGPYDPAVRRPESVLGYAPGTKHTLYRDQERVIEELARTAPRRVRTWEFGKSWLGHPLKLVAVSSEENIAQLESLRKRMAVVASGATGEEAARAMENLPTFVWINQTIHGDESASFESAMWLIYNLAASRNQRVADALKKTVVLINPVYNPDGHERFTLWNRSVAVGSDHPLTIEREQPSWVRGRVNHYRFDMNRDRVSLSQAETRAEVAEFFRWNPQVYIDQHGQTSEYFFPPNPMSVHAGVERDRFNKWTEVFGKAKGKAFDEKGWLYFVRDAFDLYYAGYLDSFTSLTGTIGMTHEADGGFMLRDTKDDGSPLTLELGMEKHLTTALVTIFTSADNRKALLDSYAGFKRRAVTGQHAGKFQRVVVSSDDPRPLVRLQNHLKRANIKSSFAASEFKQADANDYWSTSRGEQNFAKHSLVIDMAQQEGPLAKALLEPGQDFEPEFVKRQIEIMDKMESRNPRFGQSEFPEFYDTTAWSLIYGYGLKAWWCETAPKIATIESLPNAASPKLEDAVVGWVLDYRDDTDILATMKLAQDGVRVRVATKPMRLGGMDVRPGEFIFLKGRNDDDLKAKLEAAYKGTGARLRGLATTFPDAGKNSPGSDAIKLIAPPKIGIVMGASDWTTSYGSVRYLFEQEFEFPFVPLNVSALSRNLDDFSCIILPSGRYASLPTGFLDWIRAGGCAVVLGAEGWAIGDGRLAKLDAATLEGGKAIRDIPGTYYQGLLEGRSFLSYGFGVQFDGAAPIAIPASGSRFYKVGASGNPAVRFPEKDVRHLSGWEWPNNSAPALANTVWVHDQEMGAGRAVLFMQDPTERILTPGYHKMLLNAIFVGPG